MTLQPTSSNHNTPAVHRNLIRSLLLVLLISGGARAADPWLLSFPDISYDEKYAYFSGPKWTVFFTPRLGSLVTVPRDSLSELPPPAPVGNMFASGAYLFRCQGNALLTTRELGSEVIRTMPPPTSDAIACLPATGDARPDPTVLQENMGPITYSAPTCWFGLTLLDPTTNLHVAGIGWFDPITERFGRLYSPGLAGFSPVWVGASPDSAFMILRKETDSGKHVTKLVSYGRNSTVLTDIDWRQEGVPGDLVSAAVWGETLLLATDHAVAVWQPHQKPAAWESRSYASPDICWLYLLTFTAGKPGSKPVEFLPLKSNTPTDVRAKMGEWLEVVSPLGIEAYASPSVWEKNAVLWSQSSWNCGSKPCFARLRVPMKGNVVEADFTNVALTYIGHESEGVKVGFKAGWVRAENMAPVMMPVTPVAPSTQVPK